jgi:hypothetical protein
MSHIDAIEEWLDIGIPQWREDAELETILRETRQRLMTNSRG